MLDQRRRRWAALFCVYWGRLCQTDQSGSLIGADHTLDQSQNLDVDTVYLIQDVDPIWLDVSLSNVREAHQADVRDEDKKSMDLKHG